MTIWLYVILFFALISGVYVLMYASSEDGWIGNLLLSVSGFSLVLYAARYMKLIRTVVIVMLCVDAFLLILIWCRKRRSWNAVEVRLKNSIKAIKNIAVLTFFVLAVFVYVGTKKTEKNETEVAQKVETYGDEYSFDENVDTMLKLQEDVWKTLSPEERLKVLQCVANCEARYLGIWTPLTVKVTEMSDPLGGFYRDTERTIYINRESFLNNSAEKLVETVCHESYHAYSHRLVDLYLNADEKEQQLMVFDKVKMYADEFENYVGAETDLYEYYQQKCEIDAYVYGVNSMEAYFIKIEEYLEGEE